MSTVRGFEPSCPTRRRALHVDQAAGAGVAHAQAALEQRHGGGPLLHDQPIAPSSIVVGVGDPASTLSGPLHELLLELRLGLAAPRRR